MGSKLKLTQISSWRKYGSCNGSDPELFYPESEEETASALAICSTCRVREPCLEYALEAREKLGIWGGTTERDRRRIWRRRRRTA
ncbi:MAG: WhiB family transcriptional regulator [Acidimicrobiia bacterium]